MILDMNRLALGLGLSVALSLLACESEVTTTGGSGGGGGEVGGAGGSGGGTGGAGGACVCPSAALTFTLTDPDGLEVTEGLDLQGAIHVAGPGVWEIDTCPPNADCLQTIFTLRLEVPGLAPEIPEGAFVSLASAFNDFEGIELHRWILLRNLPVWGGVPSTSSSGSELLLFANLGVDDGAPLPITPVPHCKDPGADPNGLDALGVFDLEAQADNGPDGGPFTVEAGQVQSLWYASGADAGEYLLANVSVCDGWEWAAFEYAVTRTYPVQR